MSLHYGFLWPPLIFLLHVAASSCLHLSLDDARFYIAIERVVSYPVNAKSREGKSRSVEFSKHKKYTHTHIRLITQLSKQSPLPL